jgi:hypothetical protein
MHLRAVQAASNDLNHLLTLLLAFLLGGAVTVPLFSVQVANSANLPTKEFSGSWQGEFKGHTFVLLNLKISGDKLIGMCIHTVSIEKNSAGELTHVDEKNIEDQVLDARQDGNKLFLKIADNGDAQNAMECAFWLTSKDQAALQVLGSDGGTWKPRKLVRTSPPSAR